MRFTRVLHARVTSTLHARARYEMLTRRGEKLSAAYNNKDDWRSDAVHRLMDPAHDRWFITRESIEDTFTWNVRTLLKSAFGVAALFGLYYYMRNLVDYVNVTERGVTMKQIERDHAEVFSWEPFMTEFAAFSTDTPRNHDFYPVVAGRFRQDHRI